MQLFEVNKGIATYDIVLNLFPAKPGLFLPNAYIVRRDSSGDLTHIKAKALMNTLQSFGIGMSTFREKLLEVVALLQVKVLEEKI